MGSFFPLAEPPPPAIPEEEEDPDEEAIDPELAGADDAADAGAGAAAAGLGGAFTLADLIAVEVVIVGGLRVMMVAVSMSPTRSCPSSTLWPSL